MYDGRARSIRLELNGRPIGQAPVRGFVARFRTAYEPGTLCAIALDTQGTELARDTLESAHGPLRLAIRAEKAPARAGGIAYVAVDIVGENDVVESNCDEQLAVDVEGGELLAFGSAQPAPTESYLDGRFTTYRGRAMAIVRRTDPGIATITVRGTALPQATAEVVFA